MSRFCTNCGTEIPEEEKVCTNCGKEVVYTKTNDLLKRGLLYISKLKNISKYKIIACIAIIAVLMTCSNLLDGEQGTLRKAKIWSMFGNYKKAYDTVSELEPEEHYLQRQYYLYVLIADKLITESDTENYSSYIDDIEKCQGTLEGSKYSLPEKQYRNFNNIAANIEERKNKLSDAEAMRTKMRDILRIQEQIKSFQSGEDFMPKTVEKNVLGWQKNVNDANDIYRNIMSGDLPQYAELVSEMSRMLSTVRDPEHYSNSSVYFTKYNTQYKSIYSTELIEKIYESVETKINWDCSVGIDIVLFKNSKKVWKYKVPNYFEYFTGNESYTSIINGGDMTYDNPTKFYNNFDKILDFGNYLKRPPYIADTFDYSYSYNENDNIKELIKKYIEDMKNMGFSENGTTDQNSALTYKLSEEHYTVDIIDDYALQHLEIHIKNIKR